MEEVLRVMRNYVEKIIRFYVKASPPPGVDPHGADVAMNLQDNIARESDKLYKDLEKLLGKNSFIAKMAKEQAQLTKRLDHLTKKLGK